MSAFDLSLAEFLEIMVSYNTVFWPLQVVAYLLGLIAVFFAIRPSRWSSRVVTTVLALFWLWTGIVFGAIFFPPRLPSPSYITAFIFVVQGILLLAAGCFRQRLRFRFRSDVYGGVGALFVLYGMLGFPLVAYVLGRGYPQLLPFGLVPCPTTVFTLGMLLWSEKGLPRYLLVIPFLYALVGVVTASLGVVEDIGLVVAGLVAVPMLLYRERRTAGRVAWQGR